MMISEFIAKVTVGNGMQEVAAKVIFRVSLEITLVTFYVLSSCIEYLFPFFVQHVWINKCIFPTFYFDSLPRQGREGH